MKKNKCDEEEMLDWQACESYSSKKKYTKNISDYLYAYMKGYIGEN